MVSGIELGLGLIGIGRPWGFAHPEVPPESQAMELLERAVALGVRYFDTAPSYGVSEERFGRFLAAHGSAGLRIATKFGEHWDAARAEPFVDHSFDALRRSLDASVQRLGRIDFLQLHKTTPQALASDDVARAFAYARSLGIPAIGASVSDLESARIALTLQIIQVPYNSSSETFGPAIDEAAARGIWIAVNRPFAMGKMLYEEHPISKADAFRFILQKRFTGAILSGTKSPAHLEENVRAFAEASLLLA